MAQPHLIDGFKFGATLSPSNHISLGHTWILPSTQQSAYQFSANYAGTKVVSEQERYPVLMATIDSYGTMMSQIVHQWTPALRTKANVQVQKPNWLGQFDIDYQGSDFHLNIKAANPNIIDESGAYLVSYLQVRLCAGAAPAVRRAADAPRTRRA